MRRPLAALAALSALLIPLAACGGDDDGGGDSIQAYCDFSAGLDGQEDFPSDEQLDELIELAPDEISDDVDFVAGRFKEENDTPEDAGAVFDEPDIVERIERIEAFEQEQCGREAEEP